MWSKACMTLRSETTAAPWFEALLGVTTLDEGSVFTVGGQTCVVRNGIPRSQVGLSAEQTQTGETFGFKWQQRDSFESPASLARMREWLIARYGDVANASWLAEHGDHPLLIDA